MELHDIDQLYKHSLVLYKERPVYVEGLIDHRNIRILDLENQKFSDVPFVKAFIQPVPGRVGFVNSDSGCTFVSRVAARQYKIGLSKGNIVIKHYFKRPVGYEEDARIESEKDAVSRLKSKYFVDSIKNKYPSLQEAYDKAVANRSFYAFDKSFCVSFKGQIYFRADAKIVGDFVDGQIKPVKGCEWIIPCIGGVNGESIRAVRNQ